MQTYTLQYLSLSINPHKIEQVLADTNIFFIVGMGRSGTVFLSNLLNQSEECRVYHEHPDDRDALVKAYLDNSAARRYLLGKRRKIIASRILQSHKKVYGEVNGYFRHHTTALQEVLGAKVLHLVRDGREVVRSIMNRTAFTDNDKDHTGRIFPLPGDPYEDKWDKMDRFERVCWYWAMTTEVLLEQNLPVICLEDVTTSYDKFATQVLNNIAVDLPKELWQREISILHNISKKNTFPAYENWSAEQKEAFDQICGAVMWRLGYVGR